MNIKWIGVPMVAKIKDGAEMGPVAIQNMELGVDLDTGNVVFRLLDSESPVDTSHSA